MYQVQLQMYLKNQSIVNVSVQESNETKFVSRGHKKIRKIILADSLNTTLHLLITWKALVQAPHRAHAQVTGCLIS